MVASRSRLPKLAPDTIVRERLLHWLSERADVPLRLIAAPAGTGKTTALVSYAGASAHAAAYVAVEDGTTGAELCAAVGRRFGFDVSDAPALVEQLAGAGRCEILVDDLHVASADIVTLLERLVYDAPDNVTFVYATRSRDAIDVTRLVSLGLAAVLGADQLAFTADEASRLATSSRTRADDNDLARLLHETEGWAFALCSVLRHAATSGGELSGAFARWRRQEARHIASYVDRALHREDGQLGAAARRLFDGETLEIETIDRLETRGMFVRWRDGAYHPYRALARCPLLLETSPTNVLTPFAVRLFGAPVVSYDNRTVAWVRRRDAQLFAFLALQPNGRASRQALLRAFWPDAERPLAGQNLRSACSTMRRALAEVVGYSALTHYVTFGDDIALNLSLFSIDARSVRAHLRDADAAWDAGAGAAGLELDRAALALAAGPFLGDDVPPALAGVAAELAAHLARGRARADRTAPPARAV
ncbi:MAG TPA: hypothetical protein VHT05_14500 [Candidatus Elarobacter sp.]|nr:hypothetical protein [Candidatus Elarobacter sp.]